MAKRKNSYHDDDEYGYFYPLSRPIQVEGGLQSRSKRGAFASNWWAKRWLSVLESYGIGSRLQRGRSYARQGQVIDMQIKSGEVRSNVQGSRPKPYKVTINVTPITDAEWELALDTISKQAIFAAQLLDGVMPQEIENVFNEAKVPLFPVNARDVMTSCSCPDMTNPCKHIAAVYYLLAEYFDQDPFLIFILRGRTREQVIEALSIRRAAAADTTSGDDEVLISPEVAPSLEDQIDAFWGNSTWAWANPELTPPVDGLILRRLGEPPGDLKQALEVLYTVVTGVGQSKLYHDDIELESAEE